MIPTTEDSAILTFLKIALYTILQRKFYCKKITNFVAKMVGNQSNNGTLDFTEY